MFVLDECCTTQASSTTADSISAILNQGERFQLLPAKPSSSTLNFAAKNSASVFIKEEEGNHYFWKYSSL